MLSSVPRCVLTSWSTAKHCCCRAQPRLSSASASSVPQAVSQLAGTEDAQVSDILPIFISSILLRHLKLLPQASVLLSQSMRLNLGFYVCLRSLIHSALDGLLPSTQPGSGPVPAEEQRCRFLQVPSESQTKPEQTAESGSAAS